MEPATAVEVFFETLESESCRVEKGSELTIDSRFSGPDFRIQPDQVRLSGVGSSLLTSPSRAGPGNPVARLTILLADQFGVAEVASGENGV